MASPVAVAFDAAPSPAPEVGLISDLSRAERGAVYEVDDLGELDARLVALCRERGPLRAVAARIASALVLSRSWERLGFARLSDYAAERLGVSSRSVQSLARVGHRLRRSAPLEAALVSGELGWTRVRLLAQLPESEDLARWIGFAQGVSAVQLSQAVRGVDGASLEGGALEETPRSRLFEVRCAPEVRAKWETAVAVARQVVGGRVSAAEAAEAIAAEVLSAVPMDEDAQEGCREDGTSWEEAASDDAGEAEATSVEPARCLPWRRRAEDPEPPRPALPPALRPLADGLDEADAFALDARLRQALSLEQRLEARLGPWLSKVWGRWVHRALGHRTRDAYARERLGMDPTRARALVRLERGIAGRAALEQAYRSGALSWVKASALAPLAKEDDAPCLQTWVAWAQRVTVRRLRDDTERALALAETDPDAFRLGGGLPVEAHREIRATHTPGDGDHPETTREPFVPFVSSSPTQADADRGIGATHKAGEGTPTETSQNPFVSFVTSWQDPDREIGATQRAPRVWHMDRWHHAPPKSAPEENCFLRFVGPADVVQLFRAVLCTVRRRLGEETGRLPTEGQALGAMLDHALSSWGTLDENATLAKRHQVFARDGWRCAAPGCTSMRNLHDHHIRFRSAGGSDDLANRVTLCAFHHLRGIHAGLLRCVGRAPDGLRWEMGIRPGREPLVAYRSGDVHA